MNGTPLHFRPGLQRGPRSGVGSLGSAERLVGFEPRAFRFLLQRLNPLGHSPRVPLGHQDKNFASKAKFQVKPK